MLADERVPLRAGDRGTGFLASQRVGLGAVTTGRRPSGRADCGASVLGVYPWPARARLEASVSPGARAGTSVVRVVAHYTADAPVRPCASRGQWEDDLELATKARAEAATH